MHYISTNEYLTILSRVTSEHDVPAAVRHVSMRKNLHGTTTRSFTSGVNLDAFFGNCTAFKHSRFSYLKQRDQFPFTESKNSI